MPQSEAITCDLARLIAVQTTNENPHALAQAEWLSRRALRLDAHDPESWWARAAYLERAGNLAQAVAAIERSTQLGPDNFYVWHVKGLLLEKAGRNPAAEQAFAKAIEISRKVDALGPEGREFFVRERNLFLERQGRAAAP